MLPEEETNPSTVDETTAGEQPLESGDAVAGASEAGASAESQEAMTLEQYQQQIEEANRKIADLNKGFTQSSQAKAEFQRENEQLRQALGSLVNQQQMAADPIASAEQEYAEALQTFDPATILQAQKKMENLKMARFKQEAINEAIQLSRAEREVNRVQKQYGISETDLLAFQQQMTAEDLAFAKLRRDGRLDEFLSNEKAEAERKSAEAAAIGRLVGDGTPGVVPGGFDAGPVKEINDITFGLLPAAKQRELIEGGYRVRDPRGEDVTPSL
jgi:chromosome segregation ATPase